MSDKKICERPGCEIRFEPKRFWQRFCSADCRKKFADMARTRGRELLQQENQKNEPA